MFEYKDDFLMSPKTAIENGEGDAHLCNASSAVEDQLAELADLVGSGSKLHQAGDVEQIQLVDSAPALDFDLEDELSRAFATVPYSEPQKNEVFDTGVLEAAFNKDAEAPIAAPVPTTDDAPSMDFSDMIADELDRALAAEVAADATLAAPETVAPETVVEQTATSAPIDTAAPEPSFEAELTRLMGEDAAAPIPAPPMPDVVQEPWQAAEVVAGPEVPASFEAFVEPAPTAEWQPPQMSDYEVAPDYSDPAAEFGEPTMPTPPNFEPVETQSGVHIETVLGGAAALGAAAKAFGSGVSEPVSTPVFDPVASVETTETQINQARFDQAVADQELNIPANGFDAGEESLVIPEAPAIAQSGDTGGSGKRAAFVIVAVALLGGTAALGWNMFGSPSGPAPTLMASSEPVKVKPKDAGGKIVPNQDQAVYQSVDGGAKDAPKQERLKDDSEKPIAVAAVPAAKKVESRVAGTDASTTGGLVLQPRRVRTVVVKPDGTIVSATQAQPASGSAPAVKVETPKLALQPKVVEVAALDSTSAQPVKKTLYKAPQTAETKPVKTVKVAPVKVKAVPVKPVAVAPAKPVEPVNVAKVAAPKKVVAKPVKKAVVKTPSVSSPYAVQIASQRSPAAAKKSYATLARRYASVLKGKGVDIRSGVVKGKGTYYRVRIPAKTKAAANRICRQLKAKGGACFVTR